MLTPTRRWFLTGLALCVLTLFVVGRRITSVQEARLRQDAEAELAAIATLKTEQIVQYRRDRLGDAAAVADNPFLADAVARYLADPRPETAEPVLTRFHALQTHYGYADVRLVDSAGQVRLGLLGDRGPLCPVGIQAVQRGWTERRPVIADLHRCPDTAKPQIGFVAPIFEPGGAPLAAVFLQADPATRLYPMIQTWPLPSESAEMLLVRREGDHVLYLNDLRHRSGAALTLQVPLTRTEVPAVAAVTGRQGVFTGVDYRGIDVVSVIGPVPDSPWFVVVKVDHAEIYAEWQRLSLALLGMFAALVTALGAGAVALWQGRAALYYRTQVRTERELLASEARYRATLLSIGDGVIVTDARGRVETMNAVAEELTGWPLAEAAGLPVQDVFSIVNEQNREPAESPTQKVLREGTIVGLANHTLLLGRDGAERPIADSGAPVRDTAGNVSGVVLVFRDQTEERAAQRALVESERALATLMANLPGMAYRCLNDSGWGMEFVSQGAQELTGYRPGELMGEGATLYSDIVHPEDREAVHAAVQAGVAASRPFVIEYRIVDAEGVVKWVWERGQGVPDANGQVPMLEGFITDITQRKLAEETLNSERAELQTVYDYSPVMLSVMDSELRIAYANPAAARWANIPESELIGGDACAAFACIHALSDPRGGGYGVGCEDCRLRYAALDTLETGQSHQNIELHTTQVEGEQAREVTILASVASIGEIESRRLLLCMTDITDLAQAQEAVRQSELQYRHLANSGQALIWTSGPDKLCDYFNEPWLQFTGRTVEQELGFGWAEGVHPDDRERCVGIYVKAFEKREPLSMSYRLRRHDGEYRWIQDDATPRYDPEGRFLGYIGHCLDITEQRQAQEALAESQARFYRLAERAPDIVFRYSLSPEPRLEYINAACEAITGYSAEECYADPMLMVNLAHPDDAHIMAEMFARRRVAQEPLTMRWIGKDAVTRWMETRMIPVHDAEGQLVAVEGITRDITSRIVAERERRQLEQRLQDSQKLEAVGRLAGGVAHDFNNMLQTILGYAELGIEDAPPEGSLTEYLTEIREAARRSAALTRQLLAFARRQTVQPQELDLNDHAATVLKMVGRLIGASISLVLKPANDLGLVMMDPSQVDQILINMVLNARDAIEEAGEIVIETRNVTVGPEYKEQHPEAGLGEYVMLAVTDSGRGMDADTFSHLFEPFFTTKPVGEGTGLGLATVYGIVKQNQGFISVYTELGMGSSFCIYLPRHHTVARPSQQGTQRVALPHGSETVLLVEDDQALLRMSVRLLEQLGYAVLAAPHPDEAERLSREFQGEIHMLITDIVMPETNGRDLAERLRRDRPNLRCLYMSGYSANVVVHRNVLEGGEAFLQKPFAIETLAHQVRAGLDRG